MQTGFAELKCIARFERIVSDGKLCCVFSTGKTMQLHHGANNLQRIPIILSYALVALAL